MSFSVISCSDCPGQVQLQSSCVPECLYLKTSNQRVQLQVFGFIEVYAGLGNCSKCAKYAGIATASLDIMYHTPAPGKHNYMDILTDSGLAFLSSPLYIAFNHIGFIFQNVHT